MLVDSTLIIAYLESLSGKSLMPKEESKAITAFRHIGAALVAGEKVAQIIYETTQRPETSQHEPWIQRLVQQLTAATRLAAEAVGEGSSWTSGVEINQADITVAIMWRFIQHVVPDRIAASDYPGLVAFSARAESLPEFIACPLR